MSQEAAKAFVERMKTDSDFRERVFAETDVDARMLLVRAAGFDLTADELEPPSGALADAELDAVAGGAYMGPGRNDLFTSGCDK